MITFKAKTASGEIIKSALSPFTFPAGESHTKREEQRDLEPTEIAIIQPETGTMHDDLFQLAMWENYITQENYIYEQKTKRVLVLPYMPGARADRGQPFGLEVYADFIRNLDLDQIVIFDPHSPITGDELHAAADDLTFVYSDEFFAQKHLQSKVSRYTGIISPDKGAVKRATAVADLFGLPVFTAEKIRDFNTGKLTGFKLDGLPQDGTYLIVDDICDGGGTFLGLAAAIGIPKERIDLYVSHGIFSGRSRETLQDAFGNIYTTNSYGPKSKLNYTNWRTQEKHNAFTRLDVIHLLLSKIK